MDERLRFVAADLSGLYTMSELCELFSVSRKTGYKWRERYKAHGAAGLSERSHARLTIGNATAPELVGKLLDLRAARPNWGPRKLLARLALLDPDAAWPSASTAGELLKRAGLVLPRRKHRRAPARLDALVDAERPNHVWAADHKGWMRLRDGARCEPLTVTDSFSRYLIALAPTRGTTEAEARPRFEKAFSDFGLPDVIRSDNGPPFASSGVTGLTALSAWWAKLGIRHERIDPGKPQQNGRHERFHRTLIEAMHPPASGLAEQEARFCAFAQDYNHERPHEALGQRPPASLYQASARALPAKAPEPDYPPEGAVRQVRSTGEIKWRGKLVAISTAIIGEAVCVEEDAIGQWRVRFHRRVLGIIDKNTQRLRAMRPTDPK